MLDSLKTNLQSAFKSLRGKGKLTESNMRDSLRMIEEALLEADVSYPVVRDFMAEVSEKALGEKVLLQLNPEQQVTKIFHDELIELLGPGDSSLHLTKDTNVLMMCGLQGAGKTTTCGKLAKLLLQNDVRPMLVAADLQRPAAIEQLHVLGRDLGIDVYSEEGQKDPVTVCRNAVKKAKADGVKAVILDTAGRLAIDQELMKQLQRIETKVQPDQVYLVVDGMTGQDAVNSADAFNEALELDGVIMTKLDGDARGGALLSVRKVTGVPIKFIGSGEHLDNLEPFRAEGMASRILGMGDVVALVDEVQKVVTAEEQQKLEEKMLKGEFTLDDFRVQLEKMAKPGLMQKMLGLMPGMGQLNEMMQNEDTDKELKRTVGMISSMTKEERRNPKVLDNSRRQRIAKGSGVQAHEVNALIKQYNNMAPMMKVMAGGSMSDRMSALQEMQGAMMDPGARGPKVKQGTGKRLSPKEKAKLKKQRDKAKRRKSKGK